MTYKFEKLEVWKLALELNKKIYEITELLPEEEKFNLSSQIKRASTSTALNIAEGSTGQTDSQQVRFLSYAIRSHIETIACIRIITDRGYLDKSDERLEDFELLASEFFGKLQAFKKSLI
ncbi:MAG: four helix bundle protein [Balneolaceae bacterium]|nr:four helix bundle protein [Balneolaceae bacterium]